jgi:CheY-like chemotaxis protein
VTILVAEDEPDVRALVGQLLQQHGYRVIEAVDGVEALELAARHAGPIHLLVTDIAMPRLDGRELHRKLNRERPETRTLFMSGLPETELHAAAAFLPKPFRAQALVRKVHDVLRGSCAGWET